MVSSYNLIAELAMVIYAQKKNSDTAFLFTKNKNLLKTTQILSGFDNCSTQHDFIPFPTPLSPPLPIIPADL